MSDYWGKRQLETQNKIANITIAELEKQLGKYYSKAFKKVIADFEATYDKLLATIEEGHEPTPADLYKLDRYWQMQALLKEEAQKLGDKEIALLSKGFEKEWKEIYQSVALPSNTAFSTISTDNAKAMINSTWLADGKNFSQRVWGNTERLVQTLNDELMNCVITGKSSRELREKLEKRFNVSRRQANTLIRTEVTHIQTQAAAQRYQDYGLKYYKFLADTDEKTCPVCGKLDGKIFLYSEMQAGVNAPPMHPNDRCTIIPVTENVKACKYCGKPITKGEYCDDCRDEAFKYDYYSTDGRYKSTDWFKKKGATEADIVETYHNEWSMPEEDKAYNLYIKQLQKQMEETKGKNKYQYYKLQKEYFDVKLDEASWSSVNAKQNKEFKLHNFNICIDCGKAYKAEGKNNRSERCPECYEIYRKEYKRKKAQEYRKKKKSK